MPKEWIYRLNKAELVDKLNALGIDTEGTIDDLRCLLSRYVTKHPEMFPAQGGDDLSLPMPPPPVSAIIIKPATPVHAPPAPPPIKPGRTID